MDNEKESNSTLGSNDEELFKNILNVKRDTVYLLQHLPKHVMEDKRLLEIISTHSITLPPMPKEEKAVKDKSDIPDNLEYDDMDFLFDPSDTASSIFIFDENGDYSLDDFDDISEISQLNAYFTDFDIERLQSRIEEMGERVNQQINLKKDDNLEVLHPDHPQMIRFQKGFKALLEKKIYGLEFEIRINSDNLIKLKSDKEKTGLKLFKINKDLCYKQEHLDKNMMEFKNVIKDKNVLEKKLLRDREKYQEVYGKFKCENENILKMQIEVENATKIMSYFKNYKIELTDNIAVLRRVASKTKMEVAEAEDAKQKQDIYVVKLEQNLQKVTNQIVLVDAMLEAECIVAGNSNDLLSETIFQLEEIKMDKKNLLYAWNRSIYKVSQKEKKLSEISHIFSELKSIEKEVVGQIKGSSRHTLEEHNKNEDLTSRIIKINGMVVTVKKLVMSKQISIDTMQNEYLQTSKVLKQLEEELKNLIAEKQVFIVKFDKIVAELSKFEVEKSSLQQEIHIIIKELEINEGSYQYTDKMLQRLCSTVKLAEDQIALAEAEISKCLVRTSSLQHSTENLTKTLSELVRQIQPKQDIISKIKIEIERREQIISVRHKLIDTLEIKIATCFTILGGETLSPTEYQVKLLSMSLEDLDAQINIMQKEWLDDQAELIQVMKKNDLLTSSINDYRQEARLLSIKNKRLSDKLIALELELKDMDKNIQVMITDRNKFNRLINKERTSKENMELYHRNNSSYYSACLKQEEKEILLLQQQYENLVIENETKSQELIESERQLLLWEKKVELITEGKASLEGNIWYDEMKQMNIEINRMQLKKEKLRIEIDQTLTEMEKLAAKSVEIMAQDEPVNKAKQKAIIFRQIDDLKREMNSSKKELNVTTKALKSSQEEKLKLDDQIDEKNIYIQKLHQVIDVLNEDSQNIKANFNKVFTDTILNQRRQKCFQRINDGTYKTQTKNIAINEYEYIASKKQFKIIIEGLKGLILASNQVEIGLSETLKTSIELRYSKTKDKKNQVRKLNELEKDALEKLLLIYGSCKAIEDYKHNFERQSGLKNEFGNRNAYNIDEKD